jgi:hypothetical protein
MSALLEVATWAEFRDLCFTLKNLNNQFTEDANCYDIYGPDSNGLTWHIRINKSDASEFEATYKALCNFAIGSRGYAFSTNDFEFRGDGVYGACAAGQATDLDYTMAEALYVDGGDVVLENSIVGDWLEVNVIHPVYGPIAPYIKKRYVPASPAGLGTPVMQVKTPYAGKIPAGLKLRLTYHSTGIVDVKAGVNYNLHKPL